MGESTELRNWEELIPDTLGLIFQNLSLQEIITVVPRVCKTWCRVVSGPYGWQKIDIVEWSQRCKPDQLDRLLRMLIARGCGSFQSLAVSGLASDSLFSFIAENAHSLRTLVLPRSEISNAIVEQVSHRLSALTFLDVSYSTNIGPRALESFGNNCKLLTGLRRTMHPLEVDDKVSQDDEAFAIASSMPKLRHLVVAYLLITNNGVLEILSRCKELELLDLRGCWEVKLDERVLKERYKALKVLGPDVEDSYERKFWDEGVEVYSDSSDYSWEFMDDDDDDYGAWDDDDQGVEGLEVWYYVILKE